MCNTVCILDERCIRVDKVEYAPLPSRQCRGMSLPGIQIYLDMLLSGQRASPIKVDGFTWLRNARTRNCRPTHQMAGGLRRDVTGRRAPTDARAPRLRHP